MKKSIIFTSLLAIFIIAGCSNQLYVFESTEDCYITSKDSDNVYFDGEIVAEADPATFEEIDGEHLTFKDKNNVYRIYIGKSCPLGGASLEILDQVDVDDYESIDRGFYKDSNNVYSYKTMIENADPKTFEVLDHRYTKDKNYVFFKGEILEGADSESFEYLGDSYSKDKNNVYFDWGEGPFKLEADLASFEILNHSWYAKDNDYIYYKGERKEHYDVNSFEILGVNYLRDKDSVFYEGKLIKNADPDTFEIIDSAYSKDKNYYYFNNQITFKTIDGLTQEYSKGTSYFKSPDLDTIEFFIKVKFSNSSVDKMMKANLDPNYINTYAENPEKFKEELTVGDNIFTIIDNKHFDTSGCNYFYEKWNSRLYLGTMYKCGENEKIMELLESIV